MMSPLPHIDSTWTLFLDRDGVINRRIIGGFVTRPEAFEFLPGALEALRLLSARFERIFVLTNQRGIEEGLFTMADLQRVHALMQQRIRAAGWRIDGIYTCPHAKAAQCHCRKPRPGLALQAQRDFPAIRFGRSLFAGDRDTDIEMGQRLGMGTVYIAPPTEAEPELVKRARWHFESLRAFAEGCRGS